MRKLFFLLIILLACTNASAQITINGKSVSETELNEIVNGAVQQIVKEKTIAAQVQPINKPRTLDDDIVLALADLSNVPEDEKGFIKYFTFYHIKDIELLKKFYLESAFWVHSLSNESIVRPPMLVEGSSGTLFRIDIRDYGWTEQAWEKVSAREPYFREPWIEHATYSALRIEGGNSIMRGDWFIAQTATPTKQIDTDEKEIFYYTLLYAPLGRAPKNLQEFVDFWGYDINKIENKLHTVEQMLVPHSKSGVTRNNRILARTNTELGPLWMSSDFKNSNNEKNVIENLYPDKMIHPNIDAAEHIGRNKLGLQHYLITNGQGNRVDTADPAIAFDRTNPGDVRIMPGRSCVICHSEGINVPYNGLQHLLEKQVKLKYADKNFKIAADRTYFGPLSRVYADPNRQTIIEKDRESFNDAVTDVNGLTAGTNARYFKEILDWYDLDITLEQAALECGVTVDVFKDKVNRSISGRLTDLVNGGTISRQEWENPENGYFAQAMVLIKGINKIVVQTPYQNAEITSEVPEVSVLLIEATKDTNLQSRTKKLGVVKKGTKLEVIKSDPSGTWYLVVQNGTKGWLAKKDTRISNE